MPPERRAVVQARQAVMRQYDLALCRAATEHKSRESLKEKVHAAARIAVSRHASGLEVKSFVSRLVDICDDPMAIKENLLFVIDSIMRHAEKEDGSVVKKFEKAFAPHLFTLFGACVQSSTNRVEVATYLLKKLVPFWKENAWFSREMPKIIHLLVSKIDKAAEAAAKEQEEAAAPSKATPTSQKLQGTPAYSDAGTEVPSPTSVREEVPAMPPPRDQLSDYGYSPSIPVGEGQLPVQPPQGESATYGAFNEPVLTARFSSAAYSQEVHTEDLLLPPGYGKQPQEDDLFHETPMYGAETPLTQRTRDEFTEIPLPTEVGTKTLTSEVSSRIPTISPHADAPLRPPGLHDDEQVPVPTENVPTERFHNMKEEEVPMPTSPVPSPASPGAQRLYMPARHEVREDLPVPTSPVDSEFGYGGEEVPVPTSPAPSMGDDRYYGEEVPVVTSPADSPTAVDRRPAVAEEVPIPTSPVESPAEDEEHRPPVVPVLDDSGQMSALLSQHSDSADAPTESPSEDLPVPTEAQEPGDEPPSFEEVEFLLDEAARNSASSGMGPVSSYTEAPEEVVPHPHSALPTSSVPDAFPDDSTEPSSPIERVNPPTSPVTSPVDTVEFVDEAPGTMGLPSGSILDSAQLRAMQIPTSSAYVSSPTEFVPTELPAPTSPVTSLADEVETQTIREALRPALEQEVHTEMPVPTEMPSPSAAYDDEEEIPLHLPPGLREVPPVPTEVPSPTSPRLLARPPTSEAPTEPTASSQGSVPLVPPVLRDLPLPVPMEVHSPTSSQLLALPPTSEAPTVPTASSQGSVPPLPRVLRDLPPPVPTEVPSPTSPRLLARPPTSEAPTVPTASSQGSVPPLPRVLRDLPLPVPTEVPSPTSPQLLARPPTSEAPTVPTASSQGSVPPLPRVLRDLPPPVPTEVISAPASMRAEMSAVPKSSSAVTQSPSELPVPTYRPSPTEMPVQESLPPVSAAGSAALGSSVAMGSSAMASGQVMSPTEMPVPTDVPSPTTPCEEEGDTVTAPALTAPTHTVERTLTAVAHPETIDLSSPASVPVPTARPSPTSMGGAGDDEEAIVGPLPDAALAQDPPEPFVVTSPVESEEEPAEGEVPALYDSAVDASAWSVSAPVPTPTDLPARPVPTEVPSPTSLGAAQEAETMVEDIMTLPTHTLVEPKAYSSMVGMSSSAATQSPSELPVPTERPSPTELSARRPTPKPPAVAVESGMLGSSALNTSAPASGQQRSPTEMPVPTAVPSPTMPCEDEGETVTAPPGAIAKTSSIEKTLTHSRPATSVVQSSPVDLPVPTARPSPTSMNEGEDEEEAIVGPLPDAAMKPPEPHTFGIALGAGDAEVPAPHESALADSAWSESAPERTPTELPEDMPVPTDVPSPTSLRSEDEADTILEQVGTLPTQTLVPPPFEARAAEDEAAETNVPGVPQASAAAGSSVFMSDSMLAVDTSAPGQQRSPTEMPVPTAVPSPTTPCMDERETVTALPLATAKTSSIEKTVTHSRPATSVVQSSPADVPVPTARPSPTSMGGAGDDEEAIAGLRPDAALAEDPPEPFVVTSPVESEEEAPEGEVPALYDSAIDASAWSQSAPEPTPTELPAMPVPTEVPSPTSLGAAQEAETMAEDIMTLPTQTLVEPKAKASRIERTVTHSWPTTSVVQSSPVDLPVPTARPSPTSMNEGEDEEEAIVGPLPDAAMKPPEPGGFGIALGAGDAEVPALQESALADSAWSESAPERTPTELPEDMPVPTDVPSPTSLRSEDEADTIVEQVGTLPTQTLVAPKFEARAGVVAPTEDETAETNVPGVPQASAAAGSSVFMSDSGILPSPTDMPVPTELPSPTSAGPAVTGEELITTAPPPTAPTALVQEAPPDADFPPPMPESALPSSVAGSPSEMPVPLDGETANCPACGNVYAEDSIFCRKCGHKRGEAAQGTKQRKRITRSSPTEVAVLVPTERPSPTSRDIAHAPEVPVQGLGHEFSSAVGMSSSAATQSPSELPVPTERPSPTEPPVWRPTPKLPAVAAVESGMLGSSALDSSALASGQQRSPTEMPVPTDVPSPTTPCEDEGETVTAPPVATAKTSSIEKTLTHSRPATSVVQSSPVDVPVPTARPSPTSMNEGEDEEEAIVGPLPDAAMKPPEPGAFGIALGAGDAEVPAPKESALADSAWSESAPERTPTELPEDMPVPTDVPSPTSLRSEDEADTIVEQVGTLPTQTLVAPSSEARAGVAAHSEDETAETNVPGVQASAAAGSSVFMSDSGLLPSPTDMPVPTELPSPTSAMEEADVTGEELVTTAPPPTAPTALVQEAPPDADFPPPMPESAIPSSVAGSPTEMPVPVQETDEAARGRRHRKRITRSSPTEVGVLVPTERPSPTSRDIADAPEVPVQGLGHEFSSAVGMSSSAATQSPSELPVPTERPSPAEPPVGRPTPKLPAVAAVESGMLGSSALDSSALASGQQRSPTEMPVPTDVPSPTTPCEDEGETVTAPPVATAKTSSIEKTLTHSRPATSVVQSSPVDLPVPTARPSPTSMNEGEDEEEAIVGPLPDAAMKPPEPGAFGIASLALGAGDAEVPAPQESALADSAWSESAPERTPTELPEDMPVPTDVPSPTSLRSEDEADTIAEQVGTLPTQTLVAPPSEARARAAAHSEDETAETNVPGVPQASAAAGSSIFMSDSGILRSPTDMPVPTELPSPTSAAPAATGEELVTTAPPPTAPTALVQEAPPDADFPPPMPESAIPSSVAGSPSEMPVPVQETDDEAPGGRRKRVARSSPTEVAVLVPTERPSPTSHDIAWEVPVQGLGHEFSSAVGMSSSAATQSPSELPVPTERPSPAEPPVGRPTPRVPAVAAVESGMLGSSALDSSALASGQQRSPTEMPVPTDVPSPTTPEEDEGETVTAPLVATAKTSSIEKTLTHSRPATSVDQSSPVDLPVPTARPSPTSMNEGEDEEEAIVGPLPDAAMKPPEPGAFGIAPLALGAGDAEVPAPQESALADSAWSESAPERTPTELPEDMPVPTDVPSPTSLRSEDEADTIVEQVGTLPTQTLVAPSSEARARVAAPSEDETAETNVPGVQPSAAAGSSVFMSDSGILRSPTDMPVPTELPSPTSAAPAATGEELVTTAPPPTAPTALVQEAPPDADFPPPMPESAIPSSVAGSPSEMPVPVQETDDEAANCPACGNVYAEDSIFCRKCGHKRGEAARGRRRITRSSPTEVAVLVPTERPSPTSRDIARAPEVPMQGPGHEFSSAVGMSSSAATQSPSELPVPTERPSPTEPPVRPRPAVPIVALDSAMLGSSGALVSSAAASGQEQSPTEMPVPTDVPSPTTPCEDEGETITAPLTAEVHTLTAISRPATSIVLSSPVDLPVPTARPSPTSMSPGADDEEAIVGPLPNATFAHEPPELGVSAVHSPVVTSPVEGVAAIEVPEPGPAPAVPETSPADVPVPTRRPSPTSLQEPGEQEEVASAPLMESAPPEEPTPTELPVPTDKSVTEKSDRVVLDDMSEVEAVPMPVPRGRRRGGRPPSPSELPVPTEKPSPTSLAVVSAVRTLTHTRTATHSRTEEAPTRDSRMSARYPASAALSSQMMSSSAVTGSPTDMPVPTEMPSPARPSEDFEATITLSETILPTQTALAPQFQAPESQAMMSSSAPPDSPTEMPVPTEMPSPTSPASDDEDTLLTETALPPTSTLGAPTMEATLEVPTMTRRSIPHGLMDVSASQQMASSSAMQGSPTEMPVPTEVPSPTSPHGPQQEEADTIVADTAPPPTKTLVAPAFEAALESAALSAQMDVPGPEESAVAGSAAMSDSGPLPRSPTDMPVPTDVPSPTSAAGEAAHIAETDEEEAEPPVAPTLAPALVEEAPPDADFPPPMPESAPMSSSAVGSSPSELPVPVADSEDEAAARPRASPTEVAIMVPTEMPSPTSPHFARAVPEVVRAPSALPQEFSSAAAMSSSAATQSPSELPVPTERPSPTEPPVPQMKAKLPPVALESAMLGSSAAMASSALSSGAVQSPTEMPVPTDVPSPTTPCEDEGETVTAPTMPTVQSSAERTATAGSHPTALSSPVDLPVPTARPSPTSMGSAADEEEAIVGPLPKATVGHEPPEPGVSAVVESPAETSPTEEAARVEIEVPEARPVPTLQETSPADVPVPTKRPSPTSFNEPCDDEEVASAPLMESAPPEEPTPTELPVPTERSGTERSERKRAVEQSEVEELLPPIDIQSSAKRRQKAQPRAPSPSELPVPTDKPSPTSPAALPTVTAQREATATLTATREDEVPTRVTQRSARLEASVSALVSSSAMQESPTEMPVPTEVPSPTSPADEVATLVTDSALPPTRTVLQPGMEVSASQMMASSSVHEESPTEMPVPTEMPSPTSPGGDEDEAETLVTESALPPTQTQTLQLPSLEVPTRATPRRTTQVEVEALPLSGMMSDSVPEASPTEMPVPTEVPSPTSPRDDGDEAETLVTDTALPPTAVPVAPVLEAVQDSAVSEMDMDVPPQSAVMGSAAMSDSGPIPRSPSDMPVPTDVPSPTSAGEDVAPTEDEEDAEPLVPPPAAPAAPVEEAPPEADFPPPMPESAPMSASHVSSPSELPVEEQIPAKSAKIQASAPVVSSSAAPRSPSELPVPTDKPSPTSPAVRPDLRALGAAAGALGMLEVPLSPTSPAFEAAPLEDEELEVPEMRPIPTVQETSPADPAVPDEEEVASAPPVDSAPAEPTPTELPVPEPMTAVEAPMRKRAAEDSEPETFPPPLAVPTRPTKKQAASPSELPVPTERPSPTSLAAALTVTVAPREQTATATLTREEEEEVPTRVTSRQGGRVQASSSMQMVSSSAAQQSPTEMPVPTEVPTPTSPWGDEEEAETVVAATALPPTQTLAEPAPEAALDSAVLSAQMELDVPAPQESAVVESAAMSESAPEPRSPTDMPVPTDVPSPTSFAGEERTVMEEAATTAPPPTAPPVALVEEAPPDADFPPPMPESAPMSSSMVASSPSELPVPMLPDEALRPIPPPQATSAQMVSASGPIASSSAAAHSPSELPVPTDKPSPTSPVVRPEPMLATSGASIQAPQSAKPAEASAPIVSSSAVPGSPSELPVPTDKPSPTSPAARPALLLQPAAVPHSSEAPESAAAKASASAVMDSAALSSGQLESPTEMPVPTDVPSPTTPCEDEGETVTVPTVVPTAYTPTRTVPEATVPTAETLTRTFVEVAPTLDTPTQSRTVPRTSRAGPRTVRTATSTAPRTLRPWAAREPREAPTELPIEVPAAVPSPTSPAQGHLPEVDEVPLGPPIVAAPRGPVEEVPPEPPVPPELPLPPPMQVLSQPRSPTAPEMQVPTDVPSPTSPAVSSPPVEDDAELEVPERPAPTLQETSPAELPVLEDEVLRGSAPPGVSVSGPAVSSSAAPRSPSELPVPTDKPSPTSLAVQLEPQVGSAVAPQSSEAAAESALPKVSAALDSSAMMSSGGPPESPTEMPVPTDVPSPTTPREDEGETITAPTAVPTVQTPTRTVAEGTVPTAETPTRTVVEVAAPTASPTRTAAEAVPPTDTPTRTLVEAAPTVETPTQTRTATARSARTRARAAPEIAPPPMRRRPAEVPTAEPAQPALEEVPVSAIPSPTSPAEDSDQEEAVPMHVPSAAASAASAPRATAAGDAAEEPPVPLNAVSQPRSPTAPEMEVPTDVPSPTSPADLDHQEVPTMPTAEPTLLPYEESAVAPTSPASPLAEDQALEGPPGQDLRPWKRRKQRQEVAGPSTPTRRRWSAPPVPGTPTEEGVERTPTEDVLLLPPQGRVGSAARASPTEAGESSTYLAQEAEEPLPATPTYTADSPEFQEENEPETPTLEPDDEELYEWEEELAKSGGALPGIIVDVNVVRGGEPEHLDAAQLAQLSSVELARRLAAPGALLAARAQGLMTMARTPAVVRLPGMEPPTPSYDPDEEDEDFQLLHEEPSEDVYVPAAAGSAAAAEINAGRRRPQQEELPPWKRRQRRRQE